MNNINTPGGHHFGSHQQLYLVCAQVLHEQQLSGYTWMISTNLIQAGVNNVYRKKLLAPNMAWKGIVFWTEGNIAMTLFISGWSLYAKISCSRWQLNVTPSRRFGYPPVGRGHSPWSCICMSIVLHNPYDNEHTT